MSLLIAAFSGGLAIGLMIAWATDAIWRDGFDELLKEKDTEARNREAAHDLYREARELLERERRTHDLTRKQLDHAMDSASRKPTLQAGVSVCLSCMEVFANEDDNPYCAACQEEES